MSEYYIASCVFTPKFPEISAKIQKYIRERYGMTIVRCCVPNYKLDEIAQRVPEKHRPDWLALPDCADFKAGDTVYSLCHNCSNIIEETKPGVNVPSLWELILSDDKFVYPDYSGMKVTIQDCWRAKERIDEQKAVRELLKKMNIEFLELEDNFDKTDFCGISLYRPQPKRNPTLAPKHYVDGAVGKFEPHTPEEQKKIMEDYCKQFTTDTVVCYCHYCHEGLELGGMNTKHIAELLFK